jgi:CHAD domain-containing protein
MTAAAPARPRRRPRPLAGLIDDVLHRAEVDLTEQEAVHDLRVACRRLEAGTRVSLGVLSRSRLRGVRDAAKVIRRSFDQARDLEVIADELASVTGLSDSFRAAVLAEAESHAVGARRRGRVDDAIETLEQVRDDITTDDVPDSGELAAVLRGHSAALFDELDRLVPESTDGALHEARISTKKLRYEMEIGAPVFPRLPAQVKRLKRLQDILGRHQDAAVGLAWAEQLVEGSFGATTNDRAALMRYYGSLRTRQRRQLRRLLTGWRDRDIRRRFAAALGPASTPASGDSVAMSRA